MKVIATVKTKCVHAGTGVELEPDKELDLPLARAEALIAAKLVKKAEGKSETKAAAAKSAKREE